MVTIAMVAIREGTPPTFETKIPFINPIPEQTAMAITIDSTRGTPNVANFMVIAPDKAATAPTEISKFPDIITKVIPAEIIPIIEDCLSKFKIFLLLKKSWRSYAY